MEFKIQIKGLESQGIRPRCCCEINQTVALFLIVYILLLAFTYFTF